MGTPWSIAALFLDLFVIPSLVVIFVWMWIRDYQRYKDLPPGPRGWPFVGSLFQLGSKSHETFQRMSKKYGSVFSVKLGVEHTVVLNDYESVREAFVEMGDSFSGRPTYFVLNAELKNRDIAMAFEWREKRRFMLQNMKSFGFGKTGSESIILNSVQMVMDDIDASKGAPMEFQYLFFLQILNVIWTYSADHPLTKSSTTSKYLCDMINVTYEGLGNLLVNFLPMLRFVPGGFGFTKHKREHKKIWKFLTDEVEAHHKSFKSGQHRDFIDAYLQEIQNRKDTPEAGTPPYNEEHLVGTLYDLFLAGSDTSNNTLLWGFLYLALHPEVQHKVQAEMDDVIGRGRPPCFSDVNKLPYLEATIQEIHRIVSLVPLSVFHAPIKDVIFRGHKIPKGTTVIQNIYAVHHDPKCWIDPENFRPERFLDAQKRVLKPPYYMPFSIGSRYCPGEPMAKMELHLFFGVLLHKYNFALPAGKPIPTLEPIVGLTLAPHPYSLCVTPR